MLLRLDRDDTVFRNALILCIEESLFVERWQGRGPDVELQMNGGRHLVDMLAAGSLRSDCMELDFRVGNAEVGGDVHHHAELKIVRREESREKLLQFRQAVDDAQPHVVAELDLHHFRGEIVADLLNFLRGEPHLSPASFNQMIEQQGRKIVHFFVVGMLTAVENLRHRDHSVEPS